MLIGNGHILKGEKTKAQLGDQPQDRETLGLEVSPTLLAIADKVIK
jgi:hypothetical protein